ncbi:MAG: nucleotidyl transferase AbiEii/AbiGii toxin family protein [Nanoarchaeota archaeon]|nr:nucleotidyl transferase AbiEii/AbiGii toxin family protein [Nanoarchaeota archaeon]
MTPEIPLILRLKRISHKNIAEAQDLIIGELYKVFDKAVLHGGTALWRCYGGNRFSEDIDVYIQRDLKKINILFDSFRKVGFVVEKEKVGENSIYSSLNFNGTIVRFEALFKKVKGSLVEYTKSDGNLITIYTLTPEELIIEKSITYQKRLKIRDLYDVFFLLRHIKMNDEIKKSLGSLVKNFKQPVDKEDLKIIIIEGIVPGVEDMLNRIKREV